MRHVYFVLLMSVFAVTSTFAGIPDDADLLLWIGEGSGNTAIDGTGNGNDGTFHGNAKWVPDGKFATGISLRGAETYLEVPDLIAEEGPSCSGLSPIGMAPMAKITGFLMPVSEPFTSSFQKVLTTLTSTRKISASTLRPLTMPIGKMLNSTQQVS